MVVKTCSVGNSSVFWDENNHFIIWIIWGSWLPLVAWVLIHYNVFSLSFWTWNTMKQYSDSNLTNSCSKIDLFDAFNDYWLPFSIPFNDYVFPQLASSKSLIGIMKYACEHYAVCVWHVKPRESHNSYYIWILDMDQLKQIYV